VTTIFPVVSSHLPPSTFRPRLFSVLSKFSHNFISFGCHSHPALEGVTRGGPQLVMPLRKLSRVCSNLVESFDFFFVLLQLQHRLALQSVVLESLFFLEVRQLLVLHAKSVHQLRLVTTFLRFFLQRIVSSPSSSSSSGPDYPMCTVCTCA